MSWRRSFLSYKEKYEDTYSPPPFDDVNEEEKEKETKKSGGIHARISQCSSSSELKKRLKMKEEEGVGEEEEEEKTRRKDDRDPVPETGFTIWDASLLLAAYLKREEKMEQFLGASAASAAAGKTTRVVELGAGTGAGTLLLVESVVEKMRERNGDVRFVVTDLDVVLHLLRHNVRESGASEFVSVQRLEWGETRRKEDVESVKTLLSPSRIDLVIGADLCYTSNEEVIKNLADTVKLCGSRACVMAFCREHNPSAVDLFESLCEDTFRIKKVTNTDPLWPEHVREDSDDFVIFEMTRCVALDEWYQMYK
jgi:predicted O-methyltransferase YrrM